MLTEFYLVVNTVRTVYLFVIYLGTMYIILIGSSGYFYILLMQIFQSPIMSGLKADSVNKLQRKNILGVKLEVLRWL